jgi:3D (Asp-Asp-Asp) domain-containing protein
MKNKLLIIFIPLLFVGCATKKPVSYIGKVRATYYCAAEDPKWGNKVAMHPKMVAVAGKTVAVDPKKIPYGTHIKIPALAPIFGDSYFVAEDTGGAVKSMKSSRGKALVIDIYVDNRRQMEYLAKKTEPYLDAYLIK